MQLVALAALYLPPSQFEQDDDPEEAVYFPAVQSAHPTLELTK